MTPATLIWQPDRICVTSPQAEWQHSWVIPSAERFLLRLDADQSGNLYLRAPCGRAPYLISRDRGASFSAVPPVPGIVPLRIPETKLHRLTGVLSVLEPGRLWLYPASGEWTARELPPELQVRDVSLDAQGGVWFAGSVSSERIPGEDTEGAVRYQASLSTPFEARSPRLGVVDAARAASQGGLAELRSIDAEGEPVVATSVCSTLFEDESSFCFVLSDGQAAVKRLADEMVRYLQRPRLGTVRVFTCQGGVWDFADGRFRRYSIATALRNALSIRHRPLLIRAMDAANRELAVIVEVPPQGVTDFGQDPEFTALCLSNDGGASFKVALQHNFRDGKELTSVTWLPDP